MEELPPEVAASILAEAEAFKLPDREEHPMTGHLRVTCSAEAVRKLLPNLDFDACRVWCNLPVFRVRLFQNRRTCAETNVHYSEHCFSPPASFLDAASWWRKRVREDQDTFATFEGCFEPNSPVEVADPPLVRVDNATGKVEADDGDEVERKRTLHINRKKMEERWDKKAVAAEVRQKIDNADALLRERKRVEDEAAAAA